MTPICALFRRLLPDEAPPILRQVMVDQTTETILLPESGDARSAAETLATKMQNRVPKLVARMDGSGLPAVPLLVIGVADQVDAWLAKNHLPGRPEIMKEKGSAQAWTVRRPDGFTLAVVSALDAASLSRVGAAAAPLWPPELYCIRWRKGDQPWSLANTFSSLDAGLRFYPWRFRAETTLRIRHKCGEIKNDFPGRSVAYFPRKPGLVTVFSFPGLRDGFLLKYALFS